MATFKPNVPVVQSDPVVSVDVSAAAPLSAGLHSFVLTVVDDAGNESDRVKLDIIVRDSTRPTAVLDLVDKAGRILTDFTVQPGQSFILSAARSKDTDPGKIREYRFVMDPA